ncbi:hypothetical protein A2630_00315 [Candidatus Woesebacteria bacterium RIFCSPHIGHO2_01_FULL_44_10]|uniref:Glycosyltransferase RgtA/B/C/D-like domain-containing protein n=1 Tax=Candidatus Woesebacteria bacterium RIFCSPLOWO2_01_FULL_44_14 TaxID=1802525 RepID=A0A1F8C162_9BACT|nr:MAG: hypothetical protein A2630_00315 [Candidatus Woesebacteria bacterium RIFCSPHIGHO2_01_FULL_44_10]OGM55668.1 MAG: hypothetical protein A3F62_02495 [Candidatus Woesebacteria bacterium RIFCSPHIGHO2_12_FULL_44_11]OGM70094.1 MAG: hypothetical protein A2975_03395 [Candidatus Woesebacteria bacterium RIFCSPLOWO2_01_FULL_44_14]
MKKLIDAIEKLYLPRWLMLLLAIVLVLRIPSFFEPFSYGDEMIYLTLGNAIRKGLVLYRDIHDNKPPLLYLIAAVAGNVFWFRAILAAWSLTTIGLFWKLVNFLFGKNQFLIKVTTIFFALLTTLPLLEGQIANAENFLIGFSIAAFYVLVARKNTFRNLFVGGLLFSIAALFKIPAAFEIPVIVLFWAITAEKLDLKNSAVIAKKSLLVATGFLLPIAVTFIWFWVAGALPQYITAAFGQNVGYLSSFRPGDVRLPFLQRNAPLLIRAGIVATATLGLWLAKKRLSKPFVLATAWVLFGLFAVALSERPYSHYLLQIMAPVSILVGILVAAKKIEQVYTIFPLLLVLVVPVKYKFWHYPTLPYYQRFVEFAVGKINREQYFNRFDGNVNRNYAIAQFLTQSSFPDEKVFVWGDSPPIYALARRLPPIKYVAEYHIRDFSSPEEIVSTLTGSPPSYIVILPDASPFPELKQLAAEDYLLIATISEAQIYKIFPSLIQ